MMYVINKMKETNQGVNLMYIPGSNMFDTIWDNTVAEFLQRVNPDWTIIYVPAANADRIPQIMQDIITVEDLIL